MSHKVEYDTRVGLAKENLESLASALYPHNKFKYATKFGVDVEIDVVWFGDTPEEGFSSLMWQDPRTKHKDGVAYHTRVTFHKGRVGSYKTNECGVIMSQGSINFEEDFERHGFGEGDYKGLRDLADSCNYHIWDMAGYANAAREHWLDTLPKRSSLQKISGSVKKILEDIASLNQ
ncbi:MAG: hypothetical protein FWE31_06030 [Firmicutes bacterium]|nr:hypothetical protein [Bacillota bacterium]